MNIALSSNEDREDVRANLLESADYAKKALLQAQKNKDRRIML